MATSLRWDAWKLLDDVIRIREDLEKLEKDCPHKQGIALGEKDLADLAEKIEKVELDVSLMLVDNFFAEFNSGEENGIPSIELPRVFVHLDALFGDIKRANSKFDEGFVSPQTLERLYSDCGSFIKTLSSIEKKLAARPGKERAYDKAAVNSTVKEQSRDGQEKIELFSCKRQPGNLLISRYACRKRYLLSLKNGKNISNDVFGMVRKSSLDICRNCPEGYIVFKNSEKRTASFGRKLAPAPQTIPRPQG